MVESIGQPNAVVRADGYRMSVRERSFVTPRAKKTAIAVEHDYRPVAPIEEIDVALRIDSHPGDIEGPVDAGSVRHTPAFDDLVSIFIVTSSNSHCDLPMKAGRAAAITNYRRLDANLIE